MKMVCKLQRQLNDPAAPWLLYNKSQTLTRSIPNAEITAFVRDCTGDDFKSYWECEHDKAKGEVAFVKRTHAQRW